MLACPNNSVMDRLAKMICHFGYRVSFGDAKQIVPLLELLTLFADVSTFKSVDFIHGVPAEWR